MRKILVLLGCLAILGQSCSSEQSKKQNVRSVKTAQVEVYGENPSVTFPGKVKAASDINLAFRVSGTILKVNVESGTFVKKDQVLAEIDPRDYAIQLSATEAEYKQIKAEAERVIELYKKNSVTPNDYDKAVYGLKQITAKYEAHKNALNDTKLRAPFDGYIHKRMFNPNETVSAGMPVISMINTELPEVEIHIPSNNFIENERFESFSCRVDIYPDRIFPLDLIGINQKANLNQLYTMRLKIKNTEKPPYPTPGMATMVTIQYREEASNLVSIPLVAMFEKDDVNMVWIFDPASQTVGLRKIKPYAILTNGTLVVSEGLKKGEQVVSAGVHSLKEGEKVRLLSESSPSNIGNLL